MVDAPSLAAPGAAHIYPVRIYYEDTDAAGLVYYANYLKFAERARTELMRDLGAAHSAIQAAHGVAFVVRWLEADYLRPARLDDLIEVRSAVMEVGGATLTLAQDVMRAGEALVRMKVRLAMLASSGRPARLPASLRAALATLEG